MNSQVTSMDTRKGLMLTILGLMILTGVSEGHTRSLTDLELDAHLNRLNKPAVKTIKSEDGEIIDCVDIYKQPAFDHPLLKNHTIQMRPSFFPKMDVNGSSPVRPLEQIWQKSGGCPDGTIPIRRIQKNDLLRASSLQSFGKLVLDTSGGRVEFAGVKAIGGPYHGARADISAWGISVEPNEWSHSSIVVSKRDGNYVEAGWGVDPTVFGDGRTRSFVYWSNDGNKNTGCFNLLCPGFVQVSQTIAMGTALSPLSTYDGEQHQIEPVIYKDTTLLHWWLMFGTEKVGYWPAAIFNNFDEALELQWAGAVLNRRNGRHHTTTQMGSGHFPQMMDKKASYYANVRLMDSSDNFVRLSNWEAFETVWACYRPLVPVHPDIMFYYGGPDGTGTDCDL